MLGGPMGYYIFSLIRGLRRIIFKSILSEGFVRGHPRCTSWPGGQAAADAALLRRPRREHARHPPAREPGHVRDLGGYFGSNVFFYVLGTIIWVQYNKWLVFFWGFLYNA